jgi:hypothetical protein
MPHQMKKTSYFQSGPRVFLTLGVYKTGAKLCTPMLLYISPRLINLKEIVVYPNKNVAGDAAQRLSQLLTGL